MVLMCSTLRKRRADQSSSTATIRTGSNPAAPRVRQPESRLNSHLYLLRSSLRIDHPEYGVSFACLHQLCTCSLKIRLGNDKCHCKVRAAGHRPFDRDVTERRELGFERWRRIEYLNHGMHAEVQLLEEWRHHCGAPCGRFHVQSRCADCTAFDRVTRRGQIRFASGQDFFAGGPLDDLELDRRSSVLSQSRSSRRKHSTDRSHDRLG